MAASSAAVAAPFSSFADFEDPAFSAVEWVNEVLASAEPEQSSSGSFPHASSSTLDLSSASFDIVLSDAQQRLHAAAHDAHASLDASLSSALSAVPWAVREAEKVRQRSSALRASVDGVGARVEGVEASVSAAVSEIAAADTMLRRVEDAAALLAQVARADALLARLDALLSSSAGDGEDLVSAADVVAELRATLEPLRDTEELKQRFEMLDSADVKLETLAAPRLRHALETRNANAASNARIVFDRAGRDNAFVTQYVSIRGTHVAEMWSASWRGSKDDNESNDNADSSQITDYINPKTKPAQVVDDLSSTQAALKLDSFFEQMLLFLRAEASWLATAFPDLRPVLLPSLISSALTHLKSPTISAVQPVPTSMSSSGTVRLHHAALRSTRAAADIAHLLVDECDDVAIVYDAVSAVLFPCRVFWSLWPALAAHAAESAANTLPIEHSGPVSLADTAKRVEAASIPLLAILDSLVLQITSWTVGVGVVAIPKATAAASAVVSRRILTLLRRDMSTQSDSSSALPRSPSSLTLSSSYSTTGDDWGRVAGALRLLRAISALKQSWEVRKEAGIRVSAGAASPLLDLCLSIKSERTACVTCLIERAGTGSWTEISAMCELVRDPSLGIRVMQTIEGVGDTDEDLRGLLDGVHRIVYNSMFVGIKNRFRYFDKEFSWAEDEGTGDSQEASMIGFSSSPLAYATEIADYLMTIPQQLEPYVSDEDDDDGYATPASVFSFSPSSATSPTAKSTSDGAEAVKEGDGATGEVDAAPSFAGMWIGVLSVGTMELYVEKICGISRLSAAGARQLCIDTEYICNVLAALGVTPTPEFELTRRLLESSADLAAFKEIRDRPEQAEHHNLVRRIAAVRGLSMPT
jgi:conserved oligomeric Golgi complex subunit 7